MKSAGVIKMTLNLIWGKISLRRVHTEADKNNQKRKKKITGAPPCAILNT